MGPDPLGLALSAWLDLLLRQAGGSRRSGTRSASRPCLDGPIPASGLIVLVAPVVGAGSLVGRFRRARGTERRQQRWLAWGATLAALALFLAVAEVVVHGDTPVFQAMVGAGLVLLSLAAGAASLRYRLYAIDRIIGRTLAYGLLTVPLGSAYAGLVLALGRLLRQSSSLVVTAATRGR